VLGHIRVPSRSWGANTDPERLGIDNSPARRSCWNDGGGGAGVAIAGLAVGALFRPKALLIAENLCLRRQLVVLQRRHPRPRLSDADRRFWILASRRFNDWHNPLLIVKPETVLDWRRVGWRAYWRWRFFSSSKRWSPRDPERASSPDRTHGCRESPLGSKAHPGRIGKVRVSGFRQDRGQVYASLSQPAPNRDAARVPDAACIGYLGLRFFCVPTVLFQTLHVFFVIRLANREILHVEVTRHPTADWVAQQIVECCAWDRAPPRFLIHDRDSRYRTSFDRRGRGLGIRQVRTPFRSPRAKCRRREMSEICAI
jgi:putative transposase